MPDHVKGHGEPVTLRTAATAKAPLKRGFAKPVIEGCEVWASVHRRAETIGPAPTPKNPRAQAIRWVPYLSIMILRDGKEVAHAKVDLEGVEVEREREG